MQALVVHGIGEPKDVLRLESREVPEPSHRQVRIRVEAAPVHASDLHIMRGRYGFQPQLPAVLGLESVGVVDALGPGADGLAVGERVITVGVTGTWQQYLLADQHQVRAIPAAMTTSTAAQLLANPLTALVLTRRELDVQRGEWLLQTAAGSTVGRLVIQLGHARGFRTINVVRRRSAVAELIDFGADHVICTETENLRERVQQIAADGEVTKAIDCVAGATGAEAARALAPSGTMLVYGALSTHRETDPNKLTIPLFARSLIYETKTIRGFWLYTWLSTATPDQVSAAISETAELVTNGTLRIPEGQPFPLEAFADAMNVAEAPAHGGKPLLTLNT